ncbi:MAG: hypothetical protein L3K01_08820 [Thermoplasmata archaeon]|nr:hypothetical protein [Thermoplasmata archaeon]
MRPALLIGFSVVLVVLGGALLVAPLDQGPVTSTTVASGSSVEVAVPRSASLAGASVEVLLSWGTVPAPCAPHGVSCSRPPIERSNLVVFDCGARACADGGSYSLVGATDAAMGGKAEFNATPGHHYEIQAWTEFDSPLGTPIPVRYALVTPVLDGGFGGVLVALGAVLAVLTVRQWDIARRSVRSTDFL